MTTPNPQTQVEVPALAASRALADITRWRLLRVISAAESLPPSELAMKVGISRSSASKHLAILLKAGLVERVHRTFYRIPPAARAQDPTALDYGSFVIRLDRVR